MSCWATHSPHGCEVTRARCTQRVPCSMKNRTYNWRGARAPSDRCGREGPLAGAWASNDRGLWSLAIWKPPALILI
jgi:hypothetical protein